MPFINFQGAINDHQLNFLTLNGEIGDYLVDMDLFDAAEFYELTGFDAVIQIELLFDGYENMYPYLWGQVLRDDRQICPPDIPRSDGQGDLTKLSETVINVPAGPEPSYPPDDGDEIEADHTEYVNKC